MSMWSVFLLSLCRVCLSPRWRVGSCLLLLACSAQAANLPCADSIDVRAPLLSNGFGFDIHNTRRQVSDIRADNVAQLRVNHVHVAVGTREKRGAPAVTEQTVYFSEGSDLVAANRVSGCEYWRYSGAARNKPLLSVNPIRSSSILYVPPVAPHVGLVVAGDFHGNVYAVDARTGQEVWQAFMGTDAAHHMITGAVQVYRGTLYVPVATNEVVSTVAAFFSPCCDSHGLLRAVDVYTGRVKWTYHTAEAPRDDPRTGTRGPSGMSLWGAPLIDEAEQAVLVGTGQNLSLPTTANSDAIVSLDMASGKVKWVFQSTHGDAWNAACQAPSWLSSHCPVAKGRDFDFGAPPVLATLPGGAPVVLAGGKNGVVYALDPHTGGLIWQTRLGVGGSLGGIHWGMAVDSSKVYVGVTDVWVNKLSRLAIGDLLTGGLLANMALVPGGHPGLYALDLRSGRVVWEKHLQHVYQGHAYASLFSAAPSVTNDVLLAGSLDGVVHAFRTDDGQELWSFDTNVAVQDAQGTAGHGGTIDSVGPVPAGRDLLVNSGYSTFGGTNPWQAGNGNALFVLRLP